MENNNDSNTPFRSGFVALVGRPNVGKSTLVNACMGEKVAITSPVAQTTRKRLRAVVNTPNSQLVIIDTPGLHKPKDSLGKELNQAALAELADADVVAFLVDATKPVGTGDAWVARHVDGSEADFKLLVITKADKATPEQVTSQLGAARELAHFDDELVISAREGFNVDAFVKLVSAHLPEGPKWFPDDMDTDATPEDLVAEFVREKLFLHLRQEVPYGIAVEVENWEEDPEREQTIIHAVIYVARPMHKGMVIGRGGSVLKQVGMEARQDIRELIGGKVHLELWVKVRENWTEDAAFLRELGMGAESL